MHCICHDRVRIEMKKDDSTKFDSTVRNNKIFKCISTFEMQSKLLYNLT